MTESHMNAAEATQFGGRDYLYMVVDFLAAAGGGLVHTQPVVGI